MVERRQCLCIGVIRSYDMAVRIPGDLTGQMHPAACRFHHGLMDGVVPCGPAARRIGVDA